MPSPLTRRRIGRHRQERKRVIKTHFNWELLPYSEEAHYIAVIRDPKDIFVSNYFFIKDSVYGNAMPAVDTWFNLFLSDKFLVGDLGRQHRRLLGPAWSAERPGRVVQIDEARSGATVLDGCRFLDIRVSDDVIDEVCRRSSFEYMKGIDHKFRMWKLMAWCRRAR